MVDVPRFYNSNKHSLSAEARRGAKGVCSDSVSHHELLLPPPPHPRDTALCSRTWIPGSPGSSAVSRPKVVFRSDYSISRTEIITVIISWKCIDGVMEDMGEAGGRTRNRGK